MNIQQRAINRIKYLQSFMPTLISEKKAGNWDANSERHLLKVQMTINALQGVLLRTF